MKDNLIGRVVGYLVPHQIDPSHVKKGRKPVTEITRWAYIKHSILGGNHLAGWDVNTRQPAYIDPDTIHTVMPAGYRG